ncbi:hypothetical protein B0T13DRAFT_478723 [Neurospora crassa]|nr:hypothetical protein B0T13DRAFT_478723 [Neurospora crassa]
MVSLHKFLGKSLSSSFLGRLLPNRVFSFTLATITSAFDPDFHFLKLVVPVMVHTMYSKSAETLNGCERKRCEWHHSRLK